MTKKQQKIIADNLHAYLENFESIRIEDADYGGGFYVFSPANDTSWIQFCYNIDYLNGWLYGMVQGVNKRVPLKERS